VVLKIAQKLATGIPARHQKLLRAEVKGASSIEQHVSVFEPNLDKLKDSYLSAPEALVCLDINNNCMLVLEDHGCEPVYLESGKELGQLGHVVIHATDNFIDNPSAPSVNTARA